MVVSFHPETIDFLSRFTKRVEGMSFRHTSGLKRRAGTGKRRRRSVMIPFKRSRLYQQNLTLRSKTYGDLRTLTDTFSFKHKE